MLISLKSGVTTLFCEESASQSILGFAGHTVSAEIINTGGTLWKQL